MIAGVPSSVYRPGRAVQALWTSTDAELLVEGPAGTGKTFAVCHFLDFLARKYPGCRIGVFRRYRSLLRESFVRTFEAATGMRWPAARVSVEYRNGSRIVLGGLDHAERHRSVQFDVLYCCEATEITESDWEELQRSLRNTAIPHPRPTPETPYFRVAIADCNPDAPTHWLNRRCERGVMRRLVTTHADNPALTRDYLDRLANLAGVRRERLYLGRWVAAEGSIWPEFGPALIIEPPPREAIRWCFASIDWGYRAPGVMQVWGVFEGDRLVLLREHYRAEQSLDWWADRAREVWLEFKDRAFSGFVADPASPANIRHLNDALGPVGGRGVPRLCFEADNAFMPGVDLVRQRLAEGRIQFARDALAERDELLAAARVPCSTTEEIPTYCYKRGEDGRPQAEAPEPGSYDHGCDAMRYAAMHVWGRDLTPAPPKETYRWDSAYKQLGHDKVWAKLRKQGFKVPARC